MSENWLSHKSIVIIGGTTGLGFSAAKAMVNHGASVVVVGRNPENCLIAELNLGSSARAMQGDATHSQTSLAAIQLCIREFGSFDGLYHVAGGTGRQFGEGSLHKLTLESWNKALDLNLTSLMLSNQAAVQTFLGMNKGGTILNMGSVLGHAPSSDLFSDHAYATAKSAVIGFSKSIAATYAKNNIRVNVLAPGVIENSESENSDLHQLIPEKQILDGGRFTQNQDLDGSAVYFMSDYSKFSTGQVLAIDGGWSVTDRNHF
ncbi:NAD(P)-dependent dehydrogenase (short-subunit alcohol dehydrogenase family) [Dyadobacter jejuensis]|uniref:NAD(P)-dependent dehydrogenase (Short-subunit alcohol dehydrogenase family) n=1 Tax=Dyadobacter jejuensis TaxID=1082580 RepID=A0A316AS58_9BACT|nr:SDR family oxidoreductase [Dyadobacter jejuensis]PWJ60348.1 NAD(P)-dependent dehydrogenase (short-subunit alcohol dehydrogenase family) [Dyadobacter jejuensis]